ncbi:hypothetical protein [Rubrivirga litoralis]|uniref:Thioredoxin domain-containing protein n=1 Tax=Rubrivirga litoralis TaxID=3075598 RepID=A0ABU3BPK4_9BACT|nr:hypothetical protein [Rubrivirga sp. F394]MDT0631190.1 hypothetical protein [Rubrivirga sp. F394]
MTRPAPPRPRLLAPLAACFVLACAALAWGCGAEPSGGAAEFTSGAAHSGARDLVLPSATGPVPLAAFAGRPVVVHLAAAGDAAAWAALGEATGDLEASGAAVLAVILEETPAAELEALGYQGAPLAVVLDGEGTVRGRAAPTSGDAVFAAAAPVLAEYDLAQTVAWPGAETVDALVRAGGLVVDLGADAAPPGALRVAPDSLAAETLPADLGTPLAFVGSDAAAAAERAVGWGYASVYVADAAGRLGAVEPPRPAAPPSPRRRGGVRG